MFILNFQIELFIQIINRVQLRYVMLINNNFKIVQVRKCAVRPIRYRFLIKDAGCWNLSKLVGEPLLRVDSMEFVHILITFI